MWGTFPEFDRSLENFGKEFWLGWSRRCGEGILENFPCACKHPILSSHVYKILTLEKISEQKNLFCQDSNGLGLVQWRRQYFGDCRARKRDTCMRQFCNSKSFSIKNERFWNRSTKQRLCVCNQLIEEWQRVRRLPQWWNCYTGRRLQMQWISKVRCAANVLMSLVTQRNVKF